MSHDSKTITRKEDTISNVLLKRDSTEYLAPLFTNEPSFTPVTPIYAGKSSSCAASLTASSSGNSFSSIFSSSSGYSFFFDFFRIVCHIIYLPFLSGNSFFHSFTVFPYRIYVTMTLLYFIILYENKIFVKKKTILNY